MIDLHAHLLPGVDDGPATLDEAVAVCRAAADAGCEAMIATPHQRHIYWWNSELDELRTNLEELRDAVGPSPRLELGAEIRIDRGLMDEIDRWPDSEVLSLAGSRYLLLELPRSEPWDDTPGLIHELVLAGFRPILAHPELIRWIADDLETLERLVDLGAHLQLTAMSIDGRFGRRAMEASRALLDADLVHFVASDTHNIERRPPGMRRAYAEIAHRFDDALAHRLTVENPAAVLDDRPLTDKPPSSETAPPGFAAS